jgi:uncharacterized protein YaaW (UPF0174 family)
MRKGELIVNLMFLLGPVLAALFLVLLIEIIGCPR